MRNAVYFSLESQDTIEQTRTAPDCPNFLKTLTAIVPSFHPMYSLHIQGCLGGLGPISFAKLCEKSDCSCDIGPSRCFCTFKTLLGRNGPLLIRQNLPHSCIVKSKHHPIIPSLPKPYNRRQFTHRACHSSSYVFPSLPLIRRGVIFTVLSRIAAGTE